MAGCGSSRRRQRPSGRRGAAAVATLGVRVPAWPSAGRALAGLPFPCSPRRRTRAAAPDPATLEQVEPPLRAACDLLLDGGPTSGVSFNGARSQRSRGRPWVPHATGRRGRRPPRSPPSSQARKDTAPVKSLPMIQVDVFSERPLAGNPLAVFPEAEGLSDRADAGDRHRDEPLRDDLRHAARGRRRRPGAHLHAGRRAALRRAPQHRHGLHAGPLGPGGRRSR